jgi:hypothetical protein
VRDTKSPFQTTPDPYFINAPTDLLVNGGLGVVVFAIASLFGPALLGSWNSWLDPYVTYAINYPHFSATWCRLYGRGESVRKFPGTAIAVPLLLAATVAACLRSGPWLSAYLIKLMSWWTLYHWGSQIFGTTLLYALKAGFPVTRGARSALLLFLTSLSLLFVVALERLYSRGFFVGIPYPMLDFPRELSVVLTASAVISGALWLLLIAGTGARIGRRPPAMLLVPSASFLILMGLGWSSDLGVLLMQGTHALQYLLIAGSARRQTAPLRTVAWYILCFVTGLILFRALPRGVAWLGLPFALFQPVLLAALQIHHFIADGVIWKLEDPENREPLVGSLRLAPLAGALP